MHLRKTYLGSSIPSSSNGGGSEWDLGAGIDDPTKRLTLYFDRRKIARAQKIQIAGVIAFYVLLGGIAAITAVMFPSIHIEVFANILFNSLLGVVVGLLLTRRRQGPVFDLRTDGLFLSVPGYGDLSMGWDELKDVQALSAGIIRIEPVDLCRAGSSGGWYTRYSCRFQQFLRQPSVCISTACLPLNASEVVQQINVRRSFHAKGVGAASPASRTAAMPSWVSEQISQQYH